MLLKEQIEPLLGVTRLRRVRPLRHQGWIGENLGAIDEDLSCSATNVLEVVSCLGLGHFEGESSDSAIEISPR
jgi:hypothetical protein